MMLPAEPKKKKIRNWLIAVVVIFLYIWAFAGVPFAGVKENVGQIVGSIFYGLIHPDWGYVYTGDGEDLILCGYVFILTIKYSFCLLGGAQQK